MTVGRALLFFIAPALLAVAAVCTSFAAPTAVGLSFVVLAIPSMFIGAALIASDEIDRVARK